MKVKFKIEREINLYDIETDDITTIDEAVRDRLVEDPDIIYDDDIEYEIIEQHEQCPMFSTCNCRTAACRVLLPDEGCYWYRYFKKRIEEVEKQENERSGKNEK